MVASPEACQGESVLDALSKEQGKADFLGASRTPPDRTNSCPAGLQFSFGTDNLSDHLSDCRGIFAPSLLFLDVCKIKHSKKCPRRMGSHGHDAKRDSDRLPVSASGPLPPVFDYLDAIRNFQ